MPRNNWVPFKLMEQNDEVAIQWLYVDGIPFNHPFFTDTSTHCKGLPENHYSQKIITPLQHLPLEAKGIESIPPDAFIFHVSRCGSTMVTQLLSLDPAIIALSEVPVLDEILRLPVNRQFPQWKGSTDPFFTAALHLYAQKRSGAEKKLFVKTDSWHLFYYQQLRNLYPSIPFFIMYRSPDEVIRSQNRQRGMHSVPGTIEKEIFGFGEEDITFNLDLYMSRVLEKYFLRILEISRTDPMAVLINYKEGFVPIMEKVMRHTGTSFSKQWMQQVEERTRFHSKSPGEFFITEQPVDQAPDYLDACFRYYGQLEAERISVLAGSGR